MFFKRLSFSFAFLLALGLAPGAARATLVVDTGTPNNAVGAGWAFNSAHSFAGQFSLAGGLTINSIQGYFNTDVGSVTISLFSDAEDDDGGFIPGAALKSTTFNTGVGALAWTGASALNWAVGQGTYWVVFTSTYGAGSQVSMPGTAANPLANYALTQAGQWYNAADFGLAQGLRVNASAAAAAVPEPGGMALFGLGLIGVGVLTRRRR